MMPENPSMGREISLPPSSREISTAKVLPFHALLGESQLERFRREAQAAARLHHTNIVPVFGGGDDDGVHFYAMQFIHGESLEKVIEELRVLRSQSAGEVRTTESMAGKLIRPSQNWDRRSRTMSGN